MQSRAMRGGRGFDFTPPKLEKGTTKRVVKRIWQYVKKYPFYLIIVAFSIILVSGFNLILPRILQIAIDDYLKVDTLDFKGLSVIALALLIVTVAISIANYFQFYLMAILASKAVKKIRKEAFDKLVNLPIAYFDHHSHGDIMSRLTNDTEAIFNALSQVIPQLITAIITLIGAFVFMIFTSLPLMFVTLGIIPLMVWGTLLITKKGAKYFRAQQEKLGTINGVVEEDIVGLKVVKLYSQESNMIKKFTKANQELKKASFRGQLYAGMLMPLIRLIDNLLYGVLVAVGAFLFIRFGVPSVGQIQAMTNYAKMSTRPINNLAQIFNIMQTAIAGGDRVFKIIDETDEYMNTSQDTVDSVVGHVRFENVSFGYDPSTEVLHGVSFEAKAGKTIAIVGPTGSGKTTIINLLTRFYDTQGGKITIDGTSIYDICKKCLRAKVGIVLQTTYLFKGTVLENIKYGKPEASFEEVVAAAKLAQVHDIIERLPHKYATKVKEGGINFSHGERQLLSIARTILYNPAILVLDEATSSVDTRTEINIQKSMRELMKNRTSFVIAHRLQTIRNADLIVVIKDGDIHETGNHHQLIDKQGMYYQMYTTQFALND